MLKSVRAAIRAILANTVLFFASHKLEELEIGKQREEKNGYLEILHYVRIYCIQVILEEGSDKLINLTSLSLNALVASTVLALDARQRCLSLKSAIAPPTNLLSIQMKLPLF